MIAWLFKRTKSHKSLGPLQRAPYENLLINNSCWEQLLSPRAARYRNDHPQQGFKKPGELLRESRRRDGGVGEMAYGGWKLLPSIAVQLLA